MDEKIINQHLNVCTMYVSCNILAGCISEYNSIFAGCVIWNDVHCTSCLALLKEREELRKTLTGQQHFFVLLKYVSLFCINIAVTRAGTNNRKGQRQPTPTNNSWQSTIDIRRPLWPPLPVTWWSTVHLSVLARDTAKVLVCYTCFIGNFRLTRNTIF